ncbi:MAG: DUF6680 family protein [Bryobacteraceae bacterium]
MLAMDYTVKLSDLAIVFATLVGPVLAVQAQKAVERWRDASNRRDFIFKALMATRATRLAPNHIQALNMINIEFPPTKRFKKVRSAWKAYFTHLGEPMPDEPQQPVYFAKRGELSPQSPPRPDADETLMMVLFAFRRYIRPDQRDRRVQLRLPILAGLSVQAANGSTKAELKRTSQMALRHLGY